MELTRLIVTRPDGTIVGDVDPTLIVDAGFVQEVNGEHSVTLSTFEELSKNDRILWRDEMGIWHENVVEGCEGEHGEHGDTLHEYWCPWSLQHDLAATFVSSMPGTGGTPAPASSALQAALEGTERWQVGTVTQTSSGSASMWRVSGWEALQTLVEVWGGEIAARIEVDSTGVVGRYVDLLAHVGSDEPTRRFDYGGDLMGIRRKVADQPWTCRVIPLGKAQQTEEGGYGRKITIESVNGGVLWLENAWASPLVRVPSGDGWEYPTQIVENQEIDDPAALKSWASEHLEEWTTPKVSYEVDVLQLSQAGTDATGVAEGDEVVVVDHAFSEDGLAIQGRALRVEGSLLDPTQTRLTISNLGETLGGQLGDIARSVATLAEQQQATALYQATAAYMSALLDRLNAEINATGGYWYMIPGIGTRTYDVEVSDPAVGVEASKVVEVRGGNIRIADSRTATGEWDWRTVFRSGHILADLVTAAKLTAGFIGSADSGNFWDLDSGEFRMASTAQLGSKTVQQVIDAVDETITGVDVEFAQGDSPTQAPTGGWGTSAPTWQEGKYIWTRTKTTTPSGTSYSTPAMISGRDGTDGTSVTIRGSYSTLAELEAAHPTGSDGDAYMVGADLYVWNGTAWEDVGQIQGPQGPAGTSVTVTNIQYGISASASAAPSSWSTTPPTSIGGGKWLWVRTNYSNGSAATTKSYVGTNGTSVYVQSSTKVDGVTTVVLASSDGTTSTIRIADGEDGATGQRGPAGANGESNYIHTAWANSQDGTVDFSTTVSANKSYLGVCTDQNEADPTTPSSYSWSKIEGAAGADGVGVSGFVEQYYLSTSSSTQSGGAWSADPPTYVVGRFYWTRTITTYTDGRVNISNPVLARGLNSANKTAADTKAELAVLNTQEGVFNKLTNDGTLQGIYMQDNLLYVNGTYVKGGTIVAGGANNVNGVIEVHDASDATIARLDNTGANITGDLRLVTDGYANRPKSKVYAEMGAYTFVDSSGSSVESRGLHLYATVQSGSTPPDLMITNWSDSGNPNAASIRTSATQLIIETYIKNTAQGGEIYLSPAEVRMECGFVKIDGNSTRISVNHKRGYNYSMTEVMDIRSGSTTVRNQLNATASLYVTGTKSRLVETEGYGDRALYSYETPAPYFGDMGSATIGEDGLCYVEIDAIFAETARTDMAYQVFLQKCGPGDLWVEEKAPTHFVVKGTAGLAFDWEVKAHQAGFEVEHLEEKGIQDLADEDVALTTADPTEEVYQDELRYVAQMESLYESEVTDEAA